MKPVSHYEQRAADLKEQIASGKLTGKKLAKAKRDAHVWNYRVRQAKAALASVKPTKAVTAKSKSATKASPESRQKKLGHLEEMIVKEAVAQVTYDIRRRLGLGQPQNGHVA